MFIDTSTLHHIRKWLTQSYVKIVCAKMKTKMENDLPLVSKNWATSSGAKERRKEWAGPSMMLCCIVSKPQVWQ